MSASTIAFQALSKLDQRAAQHLTKQRAGDVAPAVRLLRGDAVQAARTGALALARFLTGWNAHDSWRCAGLRKDNHSLVAGCHGDRGGVWPDGSRCIQASDVVIWSGEDANAVTAARLVAAGADMSRIHFVDGITGSQDEAFDPGRDMLLLEATLEALQLSLTDPRSHRVGSGRLTPTRSRSSPCASTCGVAGPAKGLRGAGHHAFQQGHSRP